MHRTKGSMHAPTTPLVRDRLAVVPHVLRTFDVPAQPACTTCESNDTVIGAPESETLEAQPFSHAICLIKFTCGSFSRTAIRCSNNACERYAKGERKLAHIATRRQENGLNLKRWEAMGRTCLIVEECSTPKADGASVEASLAVVGASEQAALEVSR